jgi:AsmA protein
MNRPRQTLRRFTLALATTFCLVFLISAPFLIEGRLDDLRLKGATVFAAASDSYSLSSPVQLVAAPAISLESGTLSVPPNRTGLARGGEVIAMLITGSGPRMTLENATFTADMTTRDGASPALGADSVAPFVAALRKLQFDALAVRDSSIRIKLDGGTTLALHDLNTDVTSKANGLVRAKGSFQFRGEIVKFDTSFNTNADPQSASSHPVTISLTSHRIAARLDGVLILGDSPRLQSPQADLVVPNVRDAARWLGAGWPPGMGFEDFRAKGQLNWVNHTVAFQEATVQMDGNRANGTLSVNFSGKRPAVEGTLGLDALDLSKYLGTPQETTGAAGSLLTDVSSAHSLDFPLIQLVDADLRLSSSSVVLRGGTIGRAAATISLKGGKMIADIAELEIDEGTRGGGQLRIDATGTEPSYDIRGKFAALDLGRAAQAIFGHPTIQGRGDLIIEVSATGDTGKALLGSLGGKMHVTLVEGGQLGIDVDGLAAAAGADNPQTVWQEASSSSMAIDRLVAQFALANGVIKTNAAEAVAGARKVKANGAIDLPTRQLDMKLAIGDAPQPSVADTEETAEPMKERDVVGLFGPWKHPSLRSGTIETGTPHTARDPG